MDELKVGDHVILVDPKRVDRAALVTQVWNQGYINLVFVSGDEKREDSCGRQIEHETSVPIFAEGLVAGRYFRRP